MRKVFVAGVLLLFLSPLIQAQSLGAPPDPQAMKPISRMKDGLYIGIGVPFNQIQGDFDGTSYLTSGDEFFLVPKFKDGQGVKYFGGYRGGNVAFELSYAKSTHQATWDGVPVSATGAAFTVWALHIKGYLGGGRSVIQPYILCGFGMPQIVVKDGAVKGSTVGDATFSGEELDIGIGLAIFPFSRLCLFGEWTYRYIDIRMVSQPGGEDWKLADTWGTGLGASKMNLSLGVSFTF
jgi:hypothetical protein